MSDAERVSGSRFSRRRESRRSKGYDGNWVLGAEALAIPRECFSAVDLNKSFEVDRRFDLAMSMIESLRHDSKPPLCVIHPELHSFKYKCFLINSMDADSSARDAFKLFSVRLRKAIQRRIPGRKV